MIEAGADVRFEDPVGQCSVLHEAAGDCHEQLVNDLLIGGADPNSVVGPDGTTPLHQAAAGGHAVVTSALLQWGANKDALDRDGATRFWWAASEGHLAAMETLQAARADLNIRANVAGSALDIAVCFGHIPVVFTAMKSQFGFARYIISGNYLKTLWPNWLNRLW